MELKDYLHLYVGCKMKVGNRTIATLTVSVTDGDFISLRDALANSAYKPILRTLSSITLEEKNEACLFLTATQNFRMFSTGFPHYAKCTHFLLSKGVDLFGLIEAGLAIDETKLTTNVS